MAMWSKEGQLNLTRLLERVEEAVAELYKEYASQFPHHRDVWRSLSEDEIEHAAWLRSLRTRIEDGSIYLSEEHLVTSEEAIRSLDYISEELARARQGNLFLVDALNTALRLENSITEKEWFKFFAADPLELKDVLRSLGEQTQRHAEKLRGLIAQVADRGPSQ